MALVLEFQLESNAPGIPEEEQFRQWLKQCFPDVGEQTVVVRVVDEEESQQLNAQFRGKDKPTNVLSFPYEETQSMPEGLSPDDEPVLIPEHLGDLVICAPVVAREASEQGKQPEHHWAHMLVHGTLHLFGYDHISEADAEEMESLEVLKLSQIGVSDPYAI